MRAKFTIVLVIVIVIMALANFGTGYYFSQHSLKETMAQELSDTLEIADKLVTTRMGALISDAMHVAEAMARILPEGAPPPEAPESLSAMELPGQLGSAPPQSMASAPVAADGLSVPPLSNDDILDAMKEQLLRYPDFDTLTVFNGWEAEYIFGLAPANDFLLSEAGEKYLRIAYSGNEVISTTHRDGTSGRFSMYVCVPLGHGRALAASIDGMLFSRLLAPHVFWQTGNIVMLDEDGKILANCRDYLVESEKNFLGAGEYDPNMRTIDDSTRIMLMNDEGVVQYYYDGVERMNVYKTVGGASGWWKVGAVAPLNEFPTYHLLYALTISTVLFFAFGIALAAVYSRHVTDHFSRVEDKNRGLSKLHAAAMEASAAKTNFMANMSHEMRTQLNSIICLSELMLGDENVKGEAYEAFEKIYHAGDALHGTVNDILDISKIEAGKVGLVNVEYELPNVINDVVTQNMLRIGDRQIIFTLHIDGALPAKLLGDEARVKKVFNNLLSNAIKYTIDGSVDLYVFCERDVADPNVAWLKAAFKDTGIGIRAEALPTLFTSYNQIHTKSIHDVEGIGLGLAIAKAEAEILGGVIEVESEFGKGSVFTTRLRQLYVDDATIGQEVARNLRSHSYASCKLNKSKRQSRIRMPYARVLVVDDVRANLDVARGMMKKYGMQIDCVTNGSQAVAAVREENVRYNAIFMDHMMPGMDGIEAVRIIREEIGTVYAKNVPIIALTANAMADSERMFLSNGFQAFIPKPIESARLDAVIRQWVRDRRQEAALEKMGASEALRMGKTSGDSMGGIGGAGGMGGIIGMVGINGAGGADVAAGINGTGGAGFAGSISRAGGMANTNRAGGMDNTNRAGGMDNINRAGGMANTNRAGGMDNINRAGGMDNINRAGRVGGLDCDEMRSQCAWDEEPAAGQAPGAPEPPWRASARAIEGLDYDRGVARFCGDEEAYIEVLNSYAANTMPLVEMARANAEGPLESYIITVHGIKGSSRGVCAEAVGSTAEALERAAKEGNYAFIAANNRSFTDLAEKLITDIKAVLECIGGNREAEKPYADVPDAVVLERLRGACLSYAADEVDSAIEELGKNRYHTDADFVAWLKERASCTDYVEMAERLDEWLHRRPA